MAKKRERWCSVILEMDDRQITVTDVEYQVKKKVVCTKADQHHDLGEVFWKPYKYCRYLNNAVKILHTEMVAASRSEGIIESAFASMEARRGLIMEIDTKFNFANVEAYDAAKAYELPR